MAALPLVSIALGLGVQTASAASGAPVEASTRDAEWILSTQLDDGAIALQRDRTQVWPYLANHAAMGLAAASSLTGDDRYAAAAARWLTWYARHQDDRGVVSEQAGGPDGLRPTGEVDAVDASAGTYLLATEAWWRATGDRAGLATLLPAIGRAITAITTLQDLDGLTWATATYRVKYLMDQAEVYAGLLAGARVALALDDRPTALRALVAADRLRLGVADLWDEQAGGYAWAVHPDGRRDRVDWEIRYPDALQQVWAVAFGFAVGSRAQALMDHFVRRHPGWADPLAPAPVDGYARPTAWWVPGVWALLAVHDERSAQEARRHMSATAEGTGRAWPFTSGDAGQLNVARAARRDPAWLPLTVASSSRVAGPIARKPSPRGRDDR